MKAMRLLETIFGWPLNRQLNYITMKVSEITPHLIALKTQVEKVGAETTKLIATVADLKAALADVDLPQAAQDALAELETGVKTVDDLVPDASDVPTPDSGIVDSESKMPRGTAQP